MQTCVCVYVQIYSDANVQILLPCEYLILGSYCITCHSMAALSPMWPSPYGWTFQLALRWQWSFLHVNLYALPWESFLQKAPDCKLSEDRNLICFAQLTCFQHSPLLFFDPLFKTRAGTGAQSVLKKWGNKFEKLLTTWLQPTCPVVVYPTALSPKHPIYTLAK